MFISVVKLGAVIWGSMGRDSLLEKASIGHVFSFLR